MILAQIQSDLQNSTKNGDLERANCLRYVLSKIHDLEISKGKDAQLSEEEIISELQSEVKRHGESIEAFEKASREELAQKERKELEVIKSYLPAQLSHDELGKIVDETISKMDSDFGKVMGQVMAKVKGRADGSLVSQIVKEKLNS